VAHTHHHHHVQNQPCWYRDAHSKKEQPNKRMEGGQYVCICVRASWLEERDIAPQTQSSVPRGDVWIYQVLFFSALRTSGTKKNISTSKTSVRLQTPRVALSSYDNMVPLVVVHSTSSSARICTGQFSLYRIDFLGFLYCGEVRSTMYWSTGQTEC
jgi:hypothetical protein